MMSDSSASDLMAVRPFTLVHKGKPTFVLMAIALFVIYVLLRAFAWENTYLLEDHDSIFYIKQMSAYLTFAPSEIHRLSPDSTPFYPFFGALASLPGWSVESGARLCSLVFSVILFVASVGILRQTTTEEASILGLIVLALSPFLIPFSISVLSEPTYIGVVFVGLWYFLAQKSSQLLRHAAGIGIVFGLAFLNRFEALLFLPLVPLLKWAIVWRERESARVGLAPLFRWSLVYVVAFVIVAAPQVLMVSDKMDRFALNGREVWADLLLSSDDASYDEKIYGLDYSSTEINLTFLQNNEIRSENSASSVEFLHLARTLLKNLDKFYAVQIGKLGGSLLVALFLVGLLELARSQRFSEFIVLGTFAVAFLLPGLATDPKPRAVASIVPLLAILAGPGLVFVSRELCRSAERSWVRPVVSAFLLSCLLVVWSVPLLGIYLRDRLENEEYSLLDLQPVTEIVGELASHDHEKSITITSRKQYLSYLSGVDFVALPHTDFDGLLRYCRANGVDVLFLEHRLIAEFPFMNHLLGNQSPRGLELLYRAEDQFGDIVELFLVDSNHAP